MVNKDWNEKFTIIKRGETSNGKVNNIFTNFLNYDLDEMEPIGDSFISAAVPYDSSPELKRNIIAALKAHIFGYN